MVEPRYPIAFLYIKTYPHGGPALKGLKSKARRLLSSSRFLTEGEWEWVLRCDEGEKSTMQGALSRPVKRTVPLPESDTRKVLELNQRLKLESARTN